MLTLGGAFIALPSLVGWVEIVDIDRSRSESLPAAQMHERGAWATVAERKLHSYPTSGSHPAFGRISGMRSTFLSRAPRPSPHGRAIGTNPIAVALVALLAGPWLGIGSAEGFNHVSTASSATGSSGCGGISVPNGADLAQVMASEPAGTTYCLQAGSFEVGSTISTDVGDRVIGAGRDATFIDGSGLAPTSVGSSMSPARPTSKTSTSPALQPLRCPMASAVNRGRPVQIELRQGVLHGGCVSHAPNRRLP